MPVMHEVTDLIALSGGLVVRRFQHSDVFVDAARISDLPGADREVSQANLVLQILIFGWVP